jgi:hypothetical protein
LALAAALASFSVWDARRNAAIKAWPRAIGTVKELKDVELSHGRGVAVVGAYMVDGGAHPFKLVWERYELVGGVLGFGASYIAPADTPAVGSTIVLRYDPKDLWNCARADRDPETLFGFWMAAIIVSFVLGGASFLASAMGYG